MSDQPEHGDGRPPDGPSSGRKAQGGPPTPHDSIFRHVFGVPANAASQLRAVLPPDLAARLDLGRLAQVSGSFVDEALKWRHSDLLFTAPLDGQDAFVYVLVEHQSSDDPLMAFRMLRYVTRIWDAYERKHPGTKRLPAVIPLVVHHGHSRWTSPAQVADLIDFDPATSQKVRDWLPRFEYLIDDLSCVDEDQLRERPLTLKARITLVAMQTAPGNPRAAAALRPWTGQLRAALDEPGGTEWFIALVKYIEHVSEAPDSDLHDLAVSLGPDAEEAYMTTAQMLEAQGRAKERAEALVQVLTVKFGPLPEDVSETVHGASLGQLRDWTTRAITADALDQVFD